MLKSIKYTLNEVLKKVDYVNINYGNVMFDIASEKGLVETRDDMRKLNPEIQKDVQKQAAERILTAENRI